MATEGAIDTTVDAAYIRIEPTIAGGASVENVIIERPNGTIVLDLDADGHLVGVEVLGASAPLSDTVRARLTNIDERPSTSLTP